MFLGIPVSSMFKLSFKRLFLFGEFGNSFLIIECRTLGFKQGALDVDDGLIYLYLRFKGANRFCHVNGRFDSANR